MFVLFLLPRKSQFYGNKLRGRPSVPNSAPTPKNYFQRNQEKQNRTFFLPNSCIVPSTGDVYKCSDDLIPEGDGGRDDHDGLPPPDWQNPCHILGRETQPTTKTTTIRGQYVRKTFSNKPQSPTETKKTF